MELAILFVLSVAFGSKRAVPDVVNALKGRPIPSHEYRMARLEKQGHDTSKHPKPGTVREAIRANIRNAGECAAIKRDAKHDGKIAYLTENWEAIAAAKRQRLYDRAARKRAVVNAVAAARSFMLDRHAEREARRADTAETSTDPTPGAAADTATPDGTTSSGEQDPERIMINDPDYPGTRDVSLAELQRRRARQEQARNAEAQRARREHEAQQSREQREYELRMEWLRQQKSEAPPTAGADAPPGSDTSSGADAPQPESEQQGPVRAYAERIREEPAALESPELDANGQPIVDADVVDDTPEPDTRTDCDSASPTEGETDPAEAAEAPAPLATVTPITTRQENNMSQIEGGIEGATAKLDELVDHFEASNGTVTSTREAFEAARWSGVPMERMEAAITKVSGAIEDLQAAATSIRTGGYNVRDALSANSQVGSDESVRAQ